MGAPPRTKSDYMRKIASKRAQLSCSRANKDKSGTYALRQQVASLQADIAMLQARMYDAPRR